MTSYDPALGLHFSSGKSVKKSSFDKAVTKDAKNIFRDFCPMLQLFGVFLHNKYLLEVTRASNFLELFIVEIARKHYITVERSKGLFINDVT